MTQPPTWRLPAPQIQSYTEYTNIHMGKADKTPAVYLINNVALPAVLSCRDLGITITHDLSSSMHITGIVAKAHKRGNAILRCFMLRDVDMLTELIWCTCAHCLK